MKTALNVVPVTVFLARFLLMPTVIQDLSRKRQSPTYQTKTGHIETMGRDASVGATFDLEKLDSSTKAQLKEFCKSFDCPIKSSSKKEELQKALRAWVTAKSTGGHTENEDEEDEEEEVQSIHNGIDSGPVMSRDRVSRAGSSVSSKGLTPEELQDREAEREHQRVLEKMRMALEEKKILWLMTIA
ncbi:hypothetical protein NDU88_002784 [Pleurodeles waltl]|uniref:SAP domain-containing protein n=1 Tax=Pleurodeles waltl TaxID=8319 RepID=A0AAV7VDK1_PLEWA|nr:hypothetical protein NDU88_002784 [Pleurodeles waltl]